MVFQIGAQLAHSTQVPTFSRIHRCQGPLQTWHKDEGGGKEARPESTFDLHCKSYRTCEYTARTSTSALGGIWVGGIHNVNFVSFQEARGPGRTERIAPTRSFSAACGLEQNAKSVFRDDLGKTTARHLKQNPPHPSKAQEDPPVTCWLLGTAPLPWASPLHCPYVTWGSGLAALEMPIYPSILYPRMGSRMGTWKRR